MLITWPRDRLNELYERMRADFPANERPPKYALKRQILSGRLKAYALQTAAGDLKAYALCAGKDAVLVTHLAVSESARGQGIGTQVLDALAQAHQEAHPLLIVEVELPGDAKEPDERQLRQRRVAFYERAGFTAYPSVDYAAFTVKMMLMARPMGSAGLPGAEEIGPMVYQAYCDILPPLLRGQIVFKVNEKRFEQ